MTSPEKQTVAFLGIAGSYSHQAARELFPDCALVSQKRIPDVFAAVERGAVDFGVVPIENSIAGRVTETYESLSSTSVSILREHFVEIRHCLAVTAAADAKSGDVSALRKVYSHKQALMQCSDWLKANLPEAEQIEASDTASAAKTVAELGSTNAAAICSAHAAELYELDVVPVEIQNEFQNHTRFFSISREGASQKGDTAGHLMSLVFQVRHTPGALLKVLEEIAKHKLNMTKLETYMVSHGRGLPTFYADIGGDEAALSALANALAPHVSLLRVLGVYPASSLREEISGFLPVT